MKRLVTALGLSASFAIAWHTFEEIPLVVLGQPSMTGKIQSDLEDPFFRQVHEKSRIKFRTEYTPINLAGYRDTHELQLLKQKKADIISLRFPQNSADEMSLQGIDIAGMIGDFAEAKDAAHAYSDIVDKNLRTKYGAKLLGVWTFGPQEIFCTTKIRRLQDLRGLRVRTSSQQMSSFVIALGAKPAIIDFGETLTALRDGLIDCAITSSVSANHAGWPRYAKYKYPFAFQFGLNGYAITLEKWNSLTRDQQVRLQKAFDEHIRHMWRYSEFLKKDLARCFTGESCVSGTTYKGSISPVTPGDRHLARQIMKTKILPEWEAQCDLVQDSCRKEWDQRLGRLLLLWIDKDRRSKT
jgi:TRAP-type C4-dicarboxylate transport system substrate-binding protein